jgi:hypothetical protein
VILIQVREEPARARRLGRDVEIVDVGVPVLADLLYRRHAKTI